jgi:hypothetical protein
MRQRKYWGWRCENQNSSEEPSYLPPNLRRLRLEWFAKRLEIYGRWNPVKEPNQSLRVADEEGPEESELEALTSKVWDWMNGSDDEGKGGDSEKTGAR